MSPTAVDEIAEITGIRHDLLVVLGSGADQALAAWGTPTSSRRLSDIPGVLAPVAPGHADLLESYDRDGVRVLVAHGRTHLYEGQGPEPVTALVTAAAANGIQAAVLVNANGCLRDWRLGDVMAIDDHINLTGASPFNGTQFVDLSEVWDRGLLDEIAPITQRRGVYAALRGPEYQTKAETKLLAAAGADCVGMSTVLEAICLHHLGVRVAGLSVVSDLSFAAEATDPNEVVRLAAGAHPVIAACVDAICGELTRREAVRVKA